ncbi:hypothetical protein Tco_1059544 [Tanacetum coccineum]
MTYTIINMFNVVDVSKLNIIVGHPNGIEVVVTHVRSLSSECKEYEMSFQNKNSLNFFNNDEDESKSSEPYDDGRDIEIEKSKCTDNTSLGGTENTKGTRRSEGNPNDSASEGAASDADNSAILEEKDNESKGDDSFY